MNGKTFLKYRNVWLGFAMLWIVWYHMGPSPSLRILGHVKSIGYGGVDICLFASGIGCYFSLLKDSNPYSFMKRRFARLAPTYLTFITFWLTYKILTNDFPLTILLGNVLGIQKLTGLGDEFNWYISILWIVYLLTPLFFHIVISENHNVRHVIIVAFLIITSIPFWTADNYIIIIARIPIYYIGMLFGKIINKNLLTNLIIFISIATACIGMLALFIFCLLFPDKLWSHGLYWYPYIFIVPGLCMAISYVMNLIDKYKIGHCLTAMMNLLGSYSFEIYLVHIMIFDVLKYLMVQQNILPNNNYIWAIALLVVAICCITLRFVVTVFLKFKI